MDRNIIERIKKLSKELADYEHELKTLAHDDPIREELEIKIEDIQEEIWDLEDQMREDAESEYEEHTAKGWN